VYGGIKLSDNSDVVFVVFPKPIRMHDDYREYLWTPSALTLRKYLKCTGTDDKRVHRMTSHVFKKFRENMINGEDGDCIDFLEIFDYGEYAVPDEFADAVMDGAADVVHELVQALELVKGNMKYLTDDDSIKLKKHINKYLKKLKDNLKGGMMPDMKYKKIIKEYYGEDSDFDE
jgi:hypothetical protein